VEQFSKLFGYFSRCTKIVSINQLKPHDGTTLIYDFQLIVLDALICIQKRVVRFYIQKKSSE
jgi:hypothetical protein